MKKQIKIKVQAVKDCFSSNAAEASAEISAEVFSANRQTNLPAILVAKDGNLFVSFKNDELTIKRISTQDALALIEDEILEDADLLYFKLHLELLEARAARAAVKAARFFN